ncbi:hypothetical protein Fmac_011571 [Flemingia macrophylla]|uniref:Uncharacterized protein n=1 Tax=Flemingia macrophylla TaxID=520843 RepID=A0ABD1MMV3_9FABA
MSALSVTNHVRTVETSKSCASISIKTVHLPPTSSSYKGSEEAPQKQRKKVERAALPGNVAEAEEERVGHRGVAPNRRHKDDGLSVGGGGRRRVLQAARPRLRRPNRNRTHARPQLPQLLPRPRPLPLLAPHAPPRQRRHAPLQKHQRHRRRAAEVRGRHDEVGGSRGAQIGARSRGARGAIRVPYGV